MTSSLNPCQMTEETGNGGANLRLCCGTGDGNGKESHALCARLCLLDDLLECALHMSFCMVNLPARHPGT